MDEQLYIQFDDYLSNAMSDSEKIEFEKTLQSNKEINQKFELFKETNQFLELEFSQGKADFKANLKQIATEHFSENKPKTKVIPMFNRKWLSVAAAVVVMFSLWLFNQSNSINYNDYNTYAEAHFVERSDVDENLLNAQNYFNAKDYKQAVTSFEKTDLEGKTEAQLYYAISLTETENYTKSEQILTEIAHNKMYQNDANWYLALLMLKQEKQQECATYLTKINADFPQYDKVEELLKKLK